MGSGCRYPPCDIPPAPGRPCAAKKPSSCRLPPILERTWTSMRSEKPSSRCLLPIIERTWTSMRSEKPSG